MWDPTDLQFCSVITWRYIKPLVGLNKMEISGVRTFESGIKLLLGDVCEIRPQLCILYSREVYLFYTSRRNVIEVGSVMTCNM